MARKLNIYVAGGLPDPDTDSFNVPQGQIIELAKRLAVEIIRQGHTLLNGCRSDLDRTWRKLNKPAT